MIYSYTYIDHTIQNFHNGVNSFFKKMIELDLEEYDEKLHIEDWFLPSVKASSKLLLGNFKSFVSEFSGLSDSEKQNLLEVYNANQNIRALCIGEGTPMKFEMIINESFRKKLKDFFEELWTRLGNKDKGVNLEVEKLCGKILSHYQDWRANPEHTAKLCPFCGLGNLLPPTSPNRPAYDHYLPKADYPFISVNFENLAPMCHNCNSYEKTTTDPLEDEGVRRIVYYPFDSLPKDHFEAKIIPTESYSISNISSLIKNVTWDFELLSEGNPDTRLTSWDSIFRLRGRYKETLEEYEENWFKDILYNFLKKESTVSFNEFRIDYLAKIREEFATSERTVVRYAYASFILHESGVEENLNLLIAA